MQNEAAISPPFSLTVFAKVLYRVLCVDERGVGPEICLSFFPRNVDFAPLAS
jgi:hypothetical protein